MVKGILCALGACLAWSLIFVVPQYMAGFSSIEVAIGRYFVYGAFSCLLLWYKGRWGFPWSQWKKAFSLSLIANVGYYLCVLIAILYSSASLCALILGTSPIVVAVCGEMKSCGGKGVTGQFLQKLLVSGFFIFAGLFAVNIPNFGPSPAYDSVTLGLLCSFLALAAWVWYVIVNAKLLKESSQITSDDWALLLGVTTFAWTIVLLLGMLLFFPEQLHLDKFVSWNSELLQFIAGSLVIGIVGSWAATLLWNEASVRLPVALTGQLQLFETIFVVILACLIDWALPSFWEGLGAASMLLATYFAIRQFTQASSPHAAV